MIGTAQEVGVSTLTELLVHDNAETVGGDVVDATYTA